MELNMSYSSRDHLSDWPMLDAVVGGCSMLEVQELPMRSAAKQVIAAHGVQGAGSFWRGGKANGAQTGAVSDAAAEKTEAAGDNRR